MALIKCPECGREVSDRAGNCPQCGFPISSLKTDGTVMIKITNGLAGSVNIFETATGKSLWTGRSGGIAEFEIEKPTEIGIGWGLAKNKATKDTTVIAEAGKKYELAYSHNWMGTPHIVLRRVDVIDSGR